MDDQDPALRDLIAQVEASVAKVRQREREDPLDAWDLLPPRTTEVLDLGGGTVIASYPDGDTALAVLLPEQGVVFWSYDDPEGPSVSGVIPVAVVEALRRGEGRGEGAALGGGGR